MAQISFKATRKKSDSNYRVLQKNGDLQYDSDENSSDGVWIHTNKATRVFVDCDYKTGVYRIVFDGDDVTNWYE